MADGCLRAGFDWNGETDLLKRLNLESGGLVQKTIDKSVIDWDLQYCPWLTGTLAMSPYRTSVLGSGLVVYGGEAFGVPYAHYLYYGEVYGPSIPIFDDNSGEPTFFSPPEKHPTGRQLEYKTDVNPLAGSFWFERMKADHKDDILREAKSVVGAK